MLRRFLALDSSAKRTSGGKLRCPAHGRSSAPAALARNSWFQIAQRLGLHSLTGIVGRRPVVAAARPSTGASYQTGNGYKVEGIRGLYYEITNSYPFQKFKIPGADILSRAIPGEMGHFRET